QIKGNSFDLASILVNLFPNITHLRVGGNSRPRNNLSTICNLVHGWASNLVSFELYFPEIKYLLNNTYYKAQLHELFSLCNNQMLALKSLTLDLDLAVIGNYDQLD